MILSREDNVYYAKLSEQGERYEDMIKYMKQVVKSNSFLNYEERNMLSVAYKNYIGARRASWRVLQSKHYSEQENQGLISFYQKRIYHEIYNCCSEISDILQDQLIPNAKDSESKVFYMKMIADYNRYLAEIITGDEQKQVIDRAHEAYEEASKEAKSLAVTNPTRLGLALNYSVFSYELLQKPDLANSLGRIAFEDAFSQLDTVEEDEYRNISTIMLLLRDSLNLWNQDASYNQRHENEGADL